MNNTNKVLIGVGVLIVLAVGAYFPRGNSVINQVTQQLGSVTGPDNVNGYWNYAGFQEYFSSVPMATGTSTLCAIPVPIGKSRLIGFYANVVNPDGATAATFYIATSTTPFATTTNLFAGTLGAVSTTTITWLATSTETTLTKQTQSSPGYIIFDLKGALTWGTRGKCYAEFRAFN